VKLKRPLASPLALRWQAKQVSANSFGADLPASIFSCALAAEQLSKTTAASASTLRPDLVGGIEILSARAKEDFVPKRT
jgi:hypothetical protein